MSVSPISITWRVRDVPLEPRGVAAIGDVARSLALRLLECDDAQLSALMGIASLDMIVVLGDLDVLPWSDGVVYLGQDPEAPSLYLPTIYEPSVPISVFESGLRVRFPDLIFPAAILPSEARIVSLVAARPLDRERIVEWLESHSAF